MKTWSKISLVMMIFIATAGVLNAQIIPDITPNNTTTVVDEVFALHGSEITIDYDSLHQFIDDLLPNSVTDPAYDPTTPPPTASLDSLTSDSLFHSWNAVTNAQSYKASFIKLSASSGPNIEKGSIQTTNTESGLGVSNGLVLVVFQSKRNRGKIGKGNVVIVDKPVFFEQVNEDCTCEHEGPSTTTDFGGNIITNDNQDILIDYTHNGSTGYYNTTIINSDGSTASVLFKVEILEDGTTIIGKVCSEGVSNHPGASVMHVEGSRSGSRPQKLSGVLTFSGGVGFSPYEGASGSLTVTECLPDAPTEDDGLRPRLSGNSATGNTIQARPNPARSYVDVVLPNSSWDTKSNYYLMDSAGKRLAVSTNQLQEYNGKLRLDIRSLPLGVYVFVIQQKNEIMKARFLKLE